MESTENCPESTVPQVDKTNQKDNGSVSQEGNTNAEDNGIRDKSAESWTKNPDCLNLDSGEKEKELCSNKSPMSVENERLPSPELPLKVNSPHLEESKEFPSKGNPKEAGHSEETKTSVENVRLSVPESEAAPSNRTENEETTAAVKAPSECSLISTADEKETDSSKVNLIENEDIKETEECISTESRSETKESEKVESGSVKDSSEISREDCGSAKQQLSPLSNKDLLSEPGKVDDALKIEDENIGGPEDIVDSVKELPNKEQNLDSSRSEDKTDEPKEKVAVEVPEASADEPMDVDESPGEKESSIQDKKETEDNIDAIASADVDNENANVPMEISTHDETDPLSSSAEKEKNVDSNVDQSEEKNEGCEVEIHTDIVKNEEYQVSEDSADAEKSSDSSGKDKEKESSVTSMDVPDKTSKTEVTAKEGDDDVCIIPDTVPQMIRKKLKEITEKDSPATSSSNDKTTETSSEVIIEDSEEVIEIKEPRKEKRKSKDIPPLDINSPRPQRQAAKKAESQIKVLAAVESYEPPPDVPTLTILEKVTATNPCQQCGLVTFCKYQMRSKDSLFYFCRELCYKEYQSPTESSVPLISDSTSPPASVAPSITAVERPFQRTCSQCSAKIVSTDDRVLTWETMDFCTEDCLGKYQTALGSHCANCKGAVQNSSLGKYCVRFGYDIKQFCCASCLEEFKKGLKVCSYCQKDISSDRGGFLAPVGDKAQFKDFCTPLCMEKYEQMSSSVAPPAPCHECAVCTKLEPVRVEVLSASRVHKLCSQPCFAAFKFVNAIVADQCDMCKKYFDKAKTENFTIFYDDAPHSFCCKTCMNVYILAKRKIVPCSWCKVKKYNFDMIKKTTSSGQVVMMCSIHCLNLYQVSVSAVSSRRVKCDSCGTPVLAQYHLTMSDGTLRNFCSYNCVGVFQSKFSRSAVAAGGKDDSPVPTGGPKRAISRRSLISSEPETGGKGAALPVISSVTSLAPNGEPTPAGSSVPGTIKVRAPPRKFPDREPSDIGKSSGDALKSTLKQHIIVRPPHQPQRHNSGVQVRPLVHNKGVSCKPQICAKETQTDDDLGNKNTIIVPIPVPIYVPAPMCMYSAPAPVPVPFPLPIPVPIFIPTTRNSTKGIMKELKRIQEKIPADPFEAELLMMAEMVAAGKKSENADESESEEGEAPQEEPSATDAGNGVSQTFSPEAVDSSNTFGDDIMQMALKFASSLDEQPVDFEAAVAPSTITSGGPQKAAQEDESDSDPDDPEVTETKRVTRKRASRSASRSSAASKRSRRVSSSESLPVHPPSDGSSTSAKTDVEKPDANMCLKYTFGVNAWRQWVLQKNAQLEKAATSNRKLKLFKTDLLLLTADELNYSLCLFVKEVRKPNGTEYAPDTIYYLCLGIQLYLIVNGRVDNIFSDPFFEKFTECLDEISKRFSTLYDDTQFIVTRVEEEHLWEAKQLGAHSPHVLLSTLMFFNTKHFNITTVDEHMLLSFSHIMKHWKRNNNAPGSGKTPGRNVLLRFYPSQAVLDSSSKKKKVYEQSENEDDPLRCPVKLYEFYLSKCPESVKTRNDVFYLQPERSCVPDSPVWYSTMSLNKETLLKMLRRVKMVKEINMAILK